MRRDTNKWESSDNYDNFRQLFSALKSMETASRTRNALGERMFETTWTTRDNFFQGAPPNRAARGKRMGKRVARRRNGHFPVIGKKSRAVSCDWEMGGKAKGRLSRLAF